MYLLYYFFNLIFLNAFFNTEIILIQLWKKNKLNKKEKDVKSFKW